MEIRIVLRRLERRGKLVWALGGFSVRGVGGKGGGFGGLKRMV